MHRLARLSVLAALASLALPAGAGAHAERTTVFPDHTQGSVPEYRTSGGTPRVVCKADSAQRIAAMPDGAAKQRSASLLPACEYEHIQGAVDAARSGDRILVLPGVYREEPSREAPAEDPACKDLVEVLRGGWTALTYEGQRTCPKAQNLISVLGDGDDADRACDQKCRLQIEGTGRREDVLIEGDRRKLNVIRADRADGVVLRNFTIEASDFNNIYVLETNGFRLSGIETRWSREYGVLSFTSDNGVYEDIEAYGHGDSGIYPGSGPEGHCKRYGILIQRVNSYNNTLGYSGTAGNGIHVRDSSFHDNTTGIATDSLFPGHPGMPQDCAKWENNEIYSNNLDLYDREHDRMCKQPYLQRPLKYVCPAILVPTGTGLLIQGGNGNITRDNRIYDNWRYGIRLAWTPAILRGVKDLRKQYDTSHDNVFTGNFMGLPPNGQPLPNGLDVWWDEAGRGNRWSQNVTPPGRALRSSPPVLPGCPGGRGMRYGNIPKALSVATCATFDPRKNTDPPGCTWTVPPRRPQ